MKKLVGLNITGGTIDYVPYNRWFTVFGAAPESKTSAYGEVMLPNPDTVETPWASVPEGVTTVETTSTYLTIESVTSAPLNIDEFKLQKIHARYLSQQDFPNWEPKMWVSISQLDIYEELPLGVATGLTDKTLTIDISGYELPGPNIDLEWILGFRAHSTGYQFNLKAFGFVLEYISTHKYLNMIV